MKIFKKTFSLTQIYLKVGFLKSFENLLCVLSIIATFLFFQILTYLTGYTQAFEKWTDSSAFGRSDVDQIITRASWGFLVKRKLSLCSGSVALREI